MRPPTEAALPPGGRRLTMGAQARIVDGHLKVATGGSSTERGGNMDGDSASFTIMSDEPAFLGGEGRHPQPLLYVAAGIGFCLLTQLARYAAIHKVVVDRADCTVEIDYFIRGSVLRGDVEAGATACRSHFVVDSGAPADVVEKVIRLAKQGCFAEKLVETAVPIHSTFEVNGSEIRPLA
jgi:uncharacterized OsmC-like protein